MFGVWRYMGNWAAKGRVESGLQTDDNKILPCMYVSMVTHIAIVWINRVRLPVLLVVS